MKTQEYPISEEKLKSFAQEIKALGQRTYQSLSNDDFVHLKKVEFLGKFLTLSGLATAWMGVNPFSIIAIALGLMARWLLMHHISHGGYDKVPGIPPKYTSKKFAVGKRRFIDWFDWINPEAWAYEHNYLHHYYTGEPLDPDIPENNSRILQNQKIPFFLKYIIIAIISCTWKYSYYAANTLNGLRGKKEKIKNTKHQYYINLTNFLNFKDVWVRKLWFECLAPYFLFHFIVLPLLFFPLGLVAVKAVLINRILAELLTNFHTFVIIATNHAGDDLYRYSNHYQTKDEFYLRQVIGSVNFTGGTEVKDFSQMYLNYQIEHHVFPDLPMLKYREMAPEMERICLKYEVPYIKQSIFKRWAKLYQNMAGKISMKQFDPSAEDELKA